MANAPWTSPPLKAIHATAAASATAKAAQPHAKSRNGSGHSTSCIPQPTALPARDRPPAERAASWGRGGTVPARPRPRLGVARVLEEVHQRVGPHGWQRVARHRLVVVLVAEGLGGQVGLGLDRREAAREDLELRMPAARRGVGGY